MTFAAVRHGLHVLVKMGMIKPAPGGYMVRKYCAPTQPGTRISSRRESAVETKRREARAAAAAAAAEREAADLKREREFELNKKLAVSREEYEQLKKQKE